MQFSGAPTRLTSGAAWAEHDLAGAQWVHLSAADSVLVYLDQAAASPPASSGFMVNPYWPLVIHVGGHASLYYKDTPTVATTFLSVTPLPGPQHGLSPLPPLVTTPSSFGASAGTVLNSLYSDLANFTAVNLANTSSLYIAVATSTSLRYLSDSLLAAPAAYMGIGRNTSQLLTRGGESHWHAEAIVPDYDYTIMLCDPWNGPLQ
jgi:hypothetical protein